MDAPSELGEACAACCHTLRCRASAYMYWKGPLRGLCAGRLRPPYKIPNRVGRLALPSWEVAIVERLLKLGDG